MSSKTYYSQFGQDKFLEENIFKGYKYGFFIDVGANDGKTINNTLYFEKYNNWNGINIEPIYATYKQLCINRPYCINLNTAVYDTAKTVDFISNEGYTNMISGIRESYDSRHLNRLQYELQQFGGTSSIIQIQTIRLEDVCNLHYVNHINYLSIDVEGAEYNVIKSINFDKVFIDIIGFENNYEENTIPIIKYLIDNDYIVIKKSSDIFMIHRNSIFYKDTLNS